MSDLARALSEPPAKATPKCGFRDWLVRQPAEDQKAINAALDDDRWTVAALLSVLAPAGLPIKENRLRSHRIGACACGPREQ